MSTTSPQSVDDTSSSISYSGSWSASQLNLAYDGTIHSTTQNGASATFSFHGYNAVGAIFVIPACSGAVVGSWTIDGQTGKVGIPCTSYIQENVSFYPYAACSSFGQHSIVVRNAGTVPFQVDRFIYGNITTNTPSSSNPVTSSGATTTSSISTATTTSSNTGTSTGTSTSPFSQGTSSTNSTVAAGVATALNAGASSASTLEYTSTSVSSSGVLTSTGVSNDTTSSSPRSLSLGAIIGGALGALALILLFIFFLLKCRPWQRGESNEVETVPSSTLTPFSVQQRPVGHVGFDDKKVLAIAEPSLPSRSTATPSQSPPISSPEFHSDIPDYPTANPIYTSQENGRLDPASLSTPTPENRKSLAPSYSPDPNRRNFQSGLSNVDSNRASALMDVPPAYDSHIPARSSQTQPIL